MGGKYIAPDWFFLISILLCSLWWLQVMLAVDDSRSMAENCCGGVGLELLSHITKAMSRLEVGQV
jgi:midasin (ATPase involved in ribosome maturation)